MRLLLAEDEEDLSRALVTVLKHNNYSVDAVYDGAEALDYLENGDNYDGVILDIMMPKMDGLTVLKTIRKHGNSVPVLLLTAKADSVDVGKIASISADEAVSYAEELQEKGKTEGFLGDYKYMAVTDSKEGTIMYVFLNCEREISTIQTYIVASMGIGALGLIVVFIMIYFFSGKVLKPVSESYEKQKRFITDASHEIKTPLTIIDANTEVLEMMEGENEWTKSIRQMMALLLDNAMKYSSDHGSIRLALKISGKNRILTIWNTVDEIEKGNLNVLFERFYRVDASHNSKTGGFGIGLSAVGAIVTAHKGKITAESEDGKSIVFTVVL